MTQHRRPRVLLVGAYERDNFGDLLFLLQTEQYLTGAELVESAPFPGDMTALLDRTIPAFGHLLERERFDHVWTVGGEAGATTFLGALTMSMGESVRAEYLAHDAEGRRAMLAEICGEVPIEAPYMPRLSAYPLNETASSVLHSLGLAGLPGQPADRQEVLLRIFREASAVTVRDEASSAVLRKHGVAHELVPDLVHTLARTRPRPRPESPTDVLIQVSDPHLKVNGLEAMAEAIARSENLQGERIRLFLAGTAAGHDSVTSYRRIIELVHRISPSMDIGIVDARRPYDLVDVIAQARLWIGLSLHGRIVASAYGVPRLSLGKRKLDAYARTWDPDMPFGVTTETLDAAVGEALSPAVQARSAGLGDDLGAQADTRIRAVVSDVLGVDPAHRVLTRFHGLDRHRLAQVAARDAEIARQQARVATLTQKLATQTKISDADAARLQRIQATRSYRLARRVARLSRSR